MKVKDLMNCLLSKEKIENKDFNEENQSEFKKDALNINTLLYENCNFQNFECNKIKNHLPIKKQLPK